MKFPSVNVRAGLRSAVVAAVATGSILAVAAPAAHADQQIGKYWVFGQIEAAYFAAGGPQTWGVPTGPESPAANGGRFQTFANATSFYWHPLVDGGVAHQIGGAIRDTWGSYNWERGPLGWPTSNETKTTGSSGAYNTFQGGTIYWSSSTGAFEVWGGILDKWTDANREQGIYGFPTGSEYRTPDGSYIQNFQRGSITYP